MKILAPQKHIPAVLEYVRDHHEHYDGSGYPRGLEGEQITIGGRILAACDAYDALTSRRPVCDLSTARQTIFSVPDSVRAPARPAIIPALQCLWVRPKKRTVIGRGLSLHVSTRSPSPA